MVATRGGASDPARARARTLVYAHGNASSRVEGLSQLALALHLGCQCVALDCCGSGQSDGEYVSLGYKEQDDVAAVLEHERATGRGVGDVVLWGRSMGAVTALLVAATRDPSIKARVGVRETPRKPGVCGLWRPLSRSHRFWLLPWDPSIISARVLEIWTQKSLAATRTTSC